MALLHRSRRTDSTPPAPALSPAVDAARAGRRGAHAGLPRPGRVRAVAAPPAATLVPAGRGGPRPAAGGAGRERALPPSVARVAARTRLSAELLAAILEVEDRTRATLDDIERADALADRLLVRRRDRLAAAAPHQHHRASASAPAPAAQRLSA